jgi:hypothetical protein
VVWRELILEGQAEKQGIAVMAVERGCAVQDSAFPLASVRGMTGLPEFESGEKL